MGLIRGAIKFVRLLSSYGVWRRGRCYSCCGLRVVVVLHG